MVLCHNWDGSERLFRGVFSRQEAFLGPWSGKSINDWTAEVRAREREILADIAHRETAAIGEIKKAQRKRYDDYWSSYLEAMAEEDGVVPGVVNAEAK